MGKKLCGLLAVMTLLGVAFIDTLVGRALLGVVVLTPVWLVLALLVGSLIASDRDPCP